VSVGELPLLVRLAFYAGLLGAVAAVDLLGGSLLLQLVVLAVFMLAILPVLARRFGGGERHLPHASGRAVLAFAAFLTLLAGIETVLVPDFGLGALFWIVAVIVPSLEFLAYVTRRQARSA
jgi:hypothetical protein